MDRAVINVKDDQAAKVVKDAKKKAIDVGLSFSEASLALLTLWVQGKVKIEGGKK